MPPFVPRKRRAPSPNEAPKVKVPKKKPTLFDTLDETSKHTSTIHNSEDSSHDLEDESSDSSLSDISSSEFQEHGPTKRQKLDVELEDSEEDVDWEDAVITPATPIARGPAEDLQFTLGSPTEQLSIMDPHGKKKGPTKIERQIRTQTHCMHVQFLMFHNLVRNIWISNTDLQHTLLAQLPPGIKKDFEHWKVSSGTKPKLREKNIEGPSKSAKRDHKSRNGPNNTLRANRDWSVNATRQEEGVPDMSRGDPTVHFLRTLAAYWKKRFSVTAPGLRKQGYKPAQVVEDEVRSNHGDKYNLVEHGERIEGIKEYIRLARECCGSRDVGAQFFVALLRGLGFEARMVSSLQPLGLGWTKAEEAKKKKPVKMQQEAVGELDSSIEDFEDESATTKEKRPSISSLKQKSKISTTSGDGHESDPIELDSDENIAQRSDGESDVDVTYLPPQKLYNKTFDKDLTFPIYWAEVISPVTKEVIPVDPLVLTPSVAISAEQLTLFEPRGAKAEKNKQVIAYVVAFSSDGTAKDVTTRYLKRHMWPGKTKGVRMPVEKVAVLNKQGKVKKYEDYDWFKTVMSGYRRPDWMRTAVDDIEETKDLKAVKPEPKLAKEGQNETLQGYRNSAEFVLERFLRREEALKPSAKCVKIFKHGKGDKAKEEKVYRRKDVELCKTSESWHKEGRQVKLGEQPMKLVPIRAVTLTRKREVEVQEREMGEKPKQGLYSLGQTEWIIPPPIQNGIIPKNGYGNIDCFVPSMIPKGAVHVPLNSTVKICKKLGIDYAEAVIGFEFGNKMAVPVISGVVIAEENEDLVIDAWKIEEEERKRKEDLKRQKAALSMWRRMLMAMRVVERFKEEYGDAASNAKDEANPFVKKKKQESATDPSGGRQEALSYPADEEMEHEEMEGGFCRSDNEGANDDGPGGFILEDHTSPLKSKIPEPFSGTPISFQALHRKAIQANVQDLSQDEQSKESSSDLSDLEDLSMATEQLEYTQKTSRRQPKPQVAEGSSSSTIPSNLEERRNVKSPTKRDAPTKEVKQKRPTRKSARQKNLIRSSYFEESSDDDLEDSDEYEDKKLKPTRRSRGKPVTTHDRAKRDGRE
ncbi:MAG: hypothetical protein M1834_007821 [Cirrosporium novae-zelandiae]|nr:MAG: hypothetical protein M1834_007821 [Cirrosporium novae-zelandiae]